MTPSFLFLGLPFIALVFAWLRRQEKWRLAKIWLLTVSLALYAWHSPLALGFLLGSILVNFTLARLLRNAPRGRSKISVLVAAIVINLIPLLVFKYGETILDLPKASLWSFSPLGISFFTFVQIAYLVDSFQGTAAKASFLEYSLFVSFFPTVAGGPLCRSQEMIPQLSQTKPVRDKDLSAAVFLLAVGLFKKAVISDSLQPLIQAGFQEGVTLSVRFAWLTAFASVMKVYFDLSGYTDMVIGAGLLFGLRIPINFDRPFLARNISEFWRRWHMTLTHFFFDYLFFPVIRSMGMPNVPRLCLVSLLTMALIGVWHGAQWNYLVFGLMQGLALTVYHLWKGFRIRLPAFLARAITWIFVLISFVIFSAPSRFAARNVLRYMVGLNSYGPVRGGIGFGSEDFLVITLGVLSSVILIATESEDLVNASIAFIPTRRKSAFAALALAISALALISSHAERFVYFAF